MLNVYDELFVEHTTHIPAELPHLAGPAGTELTVAQRYFELDTQLQQRGLKPGTLAAVAGGHGVEIRYEEDNPFSPGDIGFPVVLLDAVPGTPSRDDHSFEVGQIFNDPAAGITIEVMEIGADATGPYADVRVTLAP